MTDDCEIENRIDDRRRALRHLTRAIDELELAGCDRLRQRLEAARSELADITPVNRGARRWRAHTARVDSGATNSRSRLAGTQRRSPHLWNF